MSERTPESYKNKKKLFPYNFCGHRVTQRLRAVCRAVPQSGKTR